MKNLFDDATAFMITFLCYKNSCIEQRDELCLMFYV